MTTSYGTILERGSRMKKLLAISATALIASTTLASPWTISPAQAAVKEGRTIENFHGIDYVALHGYTDYTDKDVKIEVLRGEKKVPIGSVIVQPDGEGFAEVHHVGGGSFAEGGDCWDEPATPDIQPGDEIRTTPADNPTDQDTSAVRDVFIDDAATTVDLDADTITMTGHVRDQPNAPLDKAADVLELRLNAGGFTWETSGRKDLREDIAPSEIAADGTFTHVFQLEGDADAQNWQRSGGEQALEWSPGAGGAEEALPSEITVFDGTGGALGGCPDLAQTAMTSVSKDIINKATIANNEKLTIGGPAQAGVTEVNLTVGGKPFSATPEGGVWAIDVLAAELEPLADGPVLIEAKFVGDTAPTVAQTKTIKKDVVAPVITANHASGTTHDGPIDVALNSDGGEQMFYTLDDSEPSESNSTPYNGQAIRLTQSDTIKVAATDTAGNKKVETFSYAIKQASQTSLSLSKAKLKQGQSLRISGAVDPAQQDQGSSVKLTMLRNGQPVTLPNAGNVTLGADGTYQLPFKAKLKGSYTVKATFSGDSDSVSSDSETKSFKVVRR